MGSSLWQRGQWVPTDEVGVDQVHVAAGRILLPGIVIGVFGGRAKRRRGCQGTRDRELEDSLCGRSQDWSPGGKGGGLLVGSPAPGPWVLLRTSPTEEKRELGWVQTLGSPRVALASGGVAQSSHSASGSVYSLSLVSASIGVASLPGGRGACCQWPQTDIPLPHQLRAESFPSFEISGSSLWARAGPQAFPGWDTVTQRKGGRAQWVNPTVSPCGPGNTSESSPEWLERPSVLFFNLLLAALAGSRLALAAASRSCSWAVMLPTSLSPLCRRAQALELTGFSVAARGPWSTGSVVVAHGLSCSLPCGILQAQRRSPCSLHWQADSSPVDHKGSVWRNQTKPQCSFWPTSLFILAFSPCFSGNFILTQWKIYFSHYLQYIYFFVLLEVWNGFGIHSLHLFERASQVSQCKESACPRRRWGFNPWVRKIPWGRKWQPAPVFLPEESPRTDEPGGLHGVPWGHKELDSTQRPSTYTHLFEKQIFQPEYNLCTVLFSLVLPYLRQYTAWVLFFLTSFLVAKPSICKQIYLSALHFQISEYAFHFGFPWHSGWFLKKFYIVKFTLCGMQIHGFLTNYTHLFSSVEWALYSWDKLHLVSF